MQRRGETVVGLSGSVNVKTSRTPHASLEKARQQAIYPSLTQEREELLQDRPPEQACRNLSEHDKLAFWNLHWRARSSSRVGLVVESPGKKGNPRGGLLLKGVVRHFAMTAAPVSEPGKWTLFGDSRDLVQRVAALHAANAALEARVAALEAEAATMRTSETAHVAAEARVAEAFMLAKPERCNGRGDHTRGLPHMSEWLFHMEDHMHCVGLPEDERVHYAQHLLTGEAFQWWLKVREQQAVWTFRDFATQLFQGVCDKAPGQVPNSYHRRYS